MTPVGSFAAKTRLAELLRRVEQGEEFMITQRGRPVAVLAPPPKPTPDLHQVLENMKTLRRGNRLEGESIRSLIEEGRRF